MRGIPVVFFMLAATLSGCIVDEGSTDDLETIFGAGSLTHNENGTLLNGRRLKAPTALSPGDRVGIGPNVELEVLP